MPNHDSADSPDPHRRPLLTATDLVRRDASTETILLDHVSLTIREGQRLALTGPSGSGKSLLLRALARLDPVAAGTLAWKGEPITDHDVPRFRSQLVYVSQHAHFQSGTVAETLAQPLRFHVHRAAGRRFDRAGIVRWLAEAERAESFLDQPVEQLSGGERQLVAILRAIQLEPTVLLLDEPTAALDQRTTEITERWILQWHASAPERAFVWATHDPTQPSRIADAVLSIEGGRWHRGPEPSPQTAGPSESSTRLDPNSAS